MEFAATKYFVDSCPTDMFNFSTGSTACELCPQGQGCTNAGTQGSCTGQQQSSLGDPICQDATPGYLSTGNAALNREVCDPGQILIGTSCQNCPAGYSCDAVAQTQTACPSGMTSASGEMYCKNIPPGSFSPDGGQTTQTCTAPDYYSNGSCQSCPSGQICDTVSGTTGTCQAGEYIKTNGNGNPKTCESCPAGKYCP